MKKLLSAVLVLSLGVGLWCDLKSQYKKGTIVLKEDPGFGKDTDWEELFYDPYKKMVVTPDDSVFVSNSRTHNVFKFDPQGRLVKKLGRKGNGPGDFLYPGDLSILDNKYLVVGETASNRRFSLWDLDGNYIKVVRTGTSVLFLTALRNHRVAYYFFNQFAQKSNGYHNNISIIIKDTDSGNEKILQNISLLNRSEIILGKDMSTGIGNFFGEVFLVQTFDGNLAVGFSNQPEIKIFSPDGDMIHSFPLKIEPIPVGKKYLKEFKDNFSDDLKKRGEKEMNRNGKFWYEVDKKILNTLDFSTIFDKYLPLYKKILVDQEGNFLVFIYTSCQKNCDLLFQVYSKEGEFICQTHLDRGKYELEIDRTSRNICFTDAGIFALVTKKEDEDDVLKLVKSSYRPAP